MKETIIYCRISKDKTNQVHSLANQKKYFNEYISKTNKLKSISTYLKSEISETGNEDCKMLDKMILDIKNRKIDVILLKEVKK